MNISDLITFTDLLAHRDVDDRLDRIQRDGAYVATTRNTVHAPSPLKAIGEILDELMCVPTDPPSWKIQVLAGKFWCRGGLWGWPGATSVKDIQPEISVPTFAYVGIQMDRTLNTMSLFVEKTTGLMPFFHPDVFPVALIKIPVGATCVVEDYIVDLRPFLNFDISLPKDKIVAEIECLAPGESNMLELGRFRGGRPLISVYQRASKAGVSFVKHVFDTQEKVTRLEGSNAPAYYDANYNGITLEPRVTIEPLIMPTTPNVIFVSIIRGTTAADGTKDFPFKNLPDAIDRLNGMPGYDTLFLEEGVYDMTREVTINVPCRIIGVSPTKSIIRMMAGRPRFGVLNEDVEFRTVQFQWSVRAADASCCIEAIKACYFFNCVVKPTVPNAVAQFLVNHAYRVMSNCVFANNFHTGAGVLPKAFTPRAITDIWMERIENNVILGEWEHPFPPMSTANNVLDLDVTGAGIGLEDTLKFYPSDSSQCIDQGIVTLVGADMDGSRTDIGLYGGKYASEARVKAYSVTDMVIFRYSYMTLFAPSLKRFKEIIPMTGFSLQSEHTRCAVSFDGGHTYVAWKERIGAWSVVDMGRFKEQANTPQELATRLVDIGDIQSRGEIIIAWGIWTTDSKYTPIIRGMDFTIQSDGEAITPLWPDKVDLLISSESLLITNNSTDRIYGLIIVIY